MDDASAAETVARALAKALALALASGLQELQERVQVFEVGACACVQLLALQAGWCGAAESI